MKSIYKQYLEKNKNAEMVRYGYTPPNDGTFTFDGLKYSCGIDFRTEEHYTTYRDCGMNTLLGQMSAHYLGEPWETCKVKEIFDTVQKAGIKKFILLDGRLSRLSHQTTSLIGEGKEFASEAELDAFVADCMKDYRHHPIFYGVQLADEPFYNKLTAIGQTYRAIKRVCPEAYIQCNLNPPHFQFNSSMLPGDGDFATRYKAYVNTFLDVTGADYFMADIYPINPDENGSVYRMYVRGLQICSEIAQERGVDFKVVMQSMWYRMNGANNWRKLSRDDIFYQVNMLMGFGVKELSYFTYWSKYDNNMNDFYFPDGCAIVSRRGEPTDLYYAVKDANAMLEKLWPVIKDFECVSDDNNCHWPSKSRPMFLVPLSSKPLKNVEYFRPDKEVALITEMYDEENDRYLYRVMNGSDPFYGNEFGVQTIEVQFDKKFRYADVFTEGEWKTVELEDGKYVAKLMPGYADYVLVY